MYRRQAGSIFLVLSLCAGPLAACNAILGISLGNPTGLGGDSSSSATGGSTSSHGGSSSSGPTSTTGSVVSSSRGTDAPVESSTPVDAGPVMVASAGGKLFSTGFGYQSHVVYAENDGRFWFFYVDDTSGVIKTLASPDFVTWAGESPIPIGGATLADGNNFSVAYANLGGTDVVHLVANTTPNGGGFNTVDIRATIAGGMIRAALPESVPNANQGGGCPQDGPQVLVLPDGHLYDVTAWVPHPSTGCDTNIFVSTNVDTGGTTFNPAFLQVGYFVSVPTFAFAHDLLSLPDAGLLMALWPDDDNSAVTTFDSIGWALSTSFMASGVDASSGTVLNAAAEIFYGAGGVASYDDWTACRLADNDVHVVRHVTVSPATAAEMFQEQVYDGNTWLQGGIPPMFESVSNTGVVLLSDANPAHGMLLVALGADNSVRISKWTKTGGWVELAPIAGTAQRQSLAGTGCGSKRPAVVWTEGVGPYSIMSADLSSLLGP
jgi:hypothetical protein